MTTQNPPPTPARLLVKSQSPPFVTVAAFCEQVLVEGSGTPSIIRLVDVVRPRSAPDAAYNAIAPVHLVIVLNSGGRKLPAINTQLLHQPPEGAAYELHRGVLTLPSGEGAKNLMLDIPMELQLRAPGTHIFILIGDGRELARAHLFAAPTGEFRPGAETGVGLRQTERPAGASGGPDHQ